MPKTVAKNKSKSHEDGLGAAAVAVASFASMTCVCESLLVGCPRNAVTAGGRCRTRQINGCGLVQQYFFVVGKSTKNWLTFFSSDGMNLWLMNINRRFVAEINALISENVAAFHEPAQGNPGVCVRPTDPPSPPRVFATVTVAVTMAACRVRRLRLDFPRSVFFSMYVCLFSWICIDRSGSRLYCVRLQKNK